MPVTHNYVTTNVDLAEQHGDRLLNDFVRCATYSGGDWSDLVYRRANGGTGNGNYINRNDTWWVGANIDVTDVQINVSNGGPILRGQLSVHRGNSRGFYVVYFSGSGGPLESYAPPAVRGYLLTPAIAAHVKGVLTIDYRGFGRSSVGNIGDNYAPAGSYKPEEQGTYTDARAMIDFLRNNRNIAANRIILHGYSLGSGPATQMASEGAPHGGLILQGPMKSVGFNAKKGFHSKGLRLHSSNSRNKKIGWAIGGVLSLGIVPGIAAAIGAAASKASSRNIGYKNNEKIAGIASPCLIASGPNDSMWEDAKALWKLRKAARQHVMFSTNNGTHFQQGRMFGTDRPYNPHKYSRVNAQTTLKMFLAGLP
ncbi:MAG: alpha/beta fold hydrolase [Methylococcaceae bacterium]|nr:alpha/beta fold hydrolase [Methylococcaceae bacterium]